MGDASREIMRLARRQVPEWTPAQVNDVLAHQHEIGPGDQEIVVADRRGRTRYFEDRSSLLRRRRALPYCRDHSAADGLQRCDFHVGRLWPVEGQRLLVRPAPHLERGAGETL